MSDNAQQPNYGPDESRPMPPNYSQASGPQQPYAQQNQNPASQQPDQRQQAFGSQQPNPTPDGSQQYGSQQGQNFDGQPNQSYGQQPYGSQQPYGDQQPFAQQPYGSQQPYSAQQPYGAQSYGGAAFGPGMASATSHAATIPMGAPLPDAAYGSGSVGFWTADQTERSTALWSHLAHAATYVIGVGWIVTLILFLINKDKSPFIRHHGAQSLNLLIVGVITCFGIGIVGGLLSIIGIGLILLLLLPVVTIYMIIIEIIAGVAANRGEGYKIPLTPNWIK